MTVNSWLVHTGASPGGPRYKVSLTPEQRKSPENGIWLCQNCAKLVDNDPVRYTVELLNYWKNGSEQAALSAIEGQKYGSPDLPDSSAEIEISYGRIQIRSERHDYLLQITLGNLGIEPITSFHVDLEFPSRVIENVEENPLYVTNRSNFETSFFRISHRSNGKELFPGDSEIIMSVQYYMIHEIYYSRGNLFDQKVSATFYQVGFRPLRVEKFFGELQIF